MVAGEGLVNEVAAPEVYTQVDNLVEGLNLAEITMSKLIGTSIRLSTSLREATNIAQLSAGMEAVAQQTQGLVDAQNNLIGNSQKLNQVYQTQGANMGEALQHYAFLKIKILENNQAMREQAQIIDKANSSIADYGAMMGKADMSKFSNEINQAKNNISALMVANKQLADEIVKNNGVISGSTEKRIQKQIELEDKYIAKKLQDQQKILDATEASEDKADQKSLEVSLKRLERAQQEAEKIIAIKQKEVDQENALNDARVQYAIERQMLMDQAQYKSGERRALAMEREIEAQRAAEERALPVNRIQRQSDTRNDMLSAKLGLAAPGSYNAMSAELSQLKIKLHDFTEEELLNDAAAQKMISRHNELDASLKRIDTSIGVNSRNVGNYSSAIENIGQKLQNFIVRDLFRAAAGFVVFTLAFEGITKLYEYFTKLSDAEQLAADKLKDFQDSLKETNTVINELNLSININTSKEKENTALLIDTLLNKNTAIDAQIILYKQLQGLYPNMLTNLSKEQDKGKESINLTTEQIKQVRNLSDAISLKNSIQEKSKGLDSLLTTQKKDQDVMDDLEKHGNPIDRKAFEYIRKHGALSGRDFGIGTTDIQPQDLTTPNGYDPEKAKNYEYSYRSLHKNGGINDQINSLTESRKKDALTYYNMMKVNDKKKGNGRVGRSAENPILQPDLTAEYELEKQRVTQSADAQKQIADDEKASLDKRIEANTNYYFALFNLAKIEKDREDSLNETRIANAQQKQTEYQSKLGDVESGKIKYKPGEKQKEISSLKQDIATEQSIVNDGYTKRTAIGEKFNTTLQKLAEKQQKDIATITLSNERDWLEQQKLQLAQSQGQIVAGYLQQQLELKKSLDAKKITTEQYNKDIDKLEKKAKQDLIDNEIKTDQALLDSKRLTMEQTIQIQDRLNELRKQKLVKVTNTESPTGAMPDLESGIDNLGKSKEEGITPEEQLQLQLKAITNFATQAIDTYKGFYDAVKQMRDNSFEAEQQQLQIKMTELQNSNQQQVEAINATTGYQITKDNELAIQSAKFASQQNAIQQEQNQLALKKAKADKTAAEAGVIMNTALAIAKTLPLLGTVATIPLGIAEIALITSLGAVQYAAAASTPLPQFKEGTTATTTPLFIAGEAGEQEYIKRPDGSGYWSGTKAKIFHEPLGTSVTPMSKIMEYAHSHVFGDIPKFSQSDGLNIIVNEIKATNERLEKSNSDLAYALVRLGKPTIQVYNKGRNDNLTYNTTHK